MKPKVYSLPFTIILIEDKEVGGFTAYFKQFENIIAEGTTKEEAISNLMATINAVFSSKSEGSTKINIKSSETIEFRGEVALGI